MMNNSKEISDLSSRVLSENIDYQKKVMREMKDAGLYDGMSLLLIALHTFMVRETLCIKFLYVPAYTCFRHIST